MKKKLFLRLCLILAVVVTAYSCRTDQFPENENYNNSSKFQLKSNRISLNKSKHKEKLITEIEKAKVDIKAFTKIKFEGKGVYYGNDFSIDTDDVIYIENGPNYHTYTFKIIRNNAPENAPVENLLLTPLPDGSYKEFLIIYHLTEAEKIKIQNEEYVNTKGKTEVIELSKENYSNILSKSQSCSYETVTINISCASGEHMPGQSGCTLKGDQRAKSFELTALVCSGSQDVGGGGGGGGSAPGPGSGGGGGEPCTDCPTNGYTPSPCTTPQIPQGPVDPSFNIDPEGCGTGVPTQPNLPLPTVDPCRKTRVSMTAANDVLKNPTVQSQMDAVLKGKVSAPNEFAMKIGDNGNSSYSFSNLVEGTSNQADLSNAILPSGNYIADGHSHAGGLGTPSGGDLYSLMGLILTNPHMKYRYVYGTKGGNTEIYALVLNDSSLISSFLAQYPKAENYDENTHAIKNDSKLGKEFYKAVEHYSSGRSENSSGENYNDNAVAMAYILEKYNAGISIAHVDSNGNLKKINANVQEITVPYSGGAKKEGIKVSKCP